VARGGVRCGGLVEKNPRVDDNITFDPDNIREDKTWGYDYGSIDGGARLIVPWRSADDEGKIQLDFAYDEAMPYRPGFAAVPRADGAPPTVASFATREMSPVWKAQWLTADLERDGEVDAKDVYDAILLAEWAGLRFSARLHRLLSKAIPDPHAVREWAVNGSLPCDSREWTAHLSAALERFAAQA
jgi:hypothetical protein